jgi:hypothetical protein
MIKENHEHVSVFQTDFKTKVFGIQMRLKIAGEGKMEATTFGMFIYADICVLVMYATSSF